jgi:Ulp1 family protease
MKRLKTQAEELQRETNLYTNNVRHQFKNSECGIYSIHFILKLLEGQSFEDISNNIINDDDMEQNRDKLFIKYF